MTDVTEFNLVPDNEEEEFAVDFGEVINVGGGGGTSDFNSLTNRPKYNNQTMTGSTNIPKVPTKTSDLTNDGSDGDSTYVEADDLATVATTGSYNDLNNKPTIPAAQVQSDWTQSDNTKVDYIKNKPTIPAAQVNSDWSAESGVAQILNKPTIPTVNDATLTITQNGVSKGTFTANDADDTTIEVADTTYSAFTGTDGNTDGSTGLVPAPETTDAGKFLCADGTWATAGGGSSVTVVQSTGTSQSDVMSQNAVSSMIFANPGTDTKIKIGSGASLSNHSYNMSIGESADANGTQAVAIGHSAKARPSGVALGDSARAGTTSSHSSCVAVGVNATVGGISGTAIGGSTSVINNYSTALGSSARARSERSVALGASAEVENDPAMAYSVALGANSKTTRAGEVNIGTGSNNFGYNSTPYRVIGGVHDGQLAQDAVTVNQINNLIDAINTATGSSISHIGTAS